MVNAWIMNKLNIMETKELLKVYVDKDGYIKVDCPDTNDREIAKRAFSEHQS